MSPDDYICIDQILYPTGGGVSFKTSSKEKPAKCVLEFRSLGSSIGSYICDTVAYPGKSVKLTQTYIKDMLIVMKHVFEGYEQHGYSLIGTDMSVDCYYTSISLAKWLYGKIIRAFGAI